jgi:hypothetical protein
MIRTEDVPLGHVLTLVTGHQVAVSGGEGVLELLRYLIQVELPEGHHRAVWPICRVSVIRQHPWLLKVKIPHEMLAREFGPYRWSWVDTMERRYGATVPLSPVELVDWQSCGYPQVPVRQHEVPFRNPVIVWPEN